MNVLVTGHEGYIGSILAPHLAGLGHEVVGLDIGLYRGCNFGDDPQAMPTLPVDVRDVTADDLSGFDAVVHYAALSNDPIGDLDPSLTGAINRDGTLQLARAARDAGVGRFVFASSCAMYGASGADDVLDESAPLNPLTAYAESKVRSEEALMALAGPGFAPVAMRNATVYGASPRLRLDIVLNNLAASAQTTGRITLLSDGSAWRPLIHVRDVAKVTGALLEAPEGTVSGEAFNVGTNEQNYIVRDLAAILADVTGCEVQIAKGSSADSRSYRVEFSKLAKAFPNVTLDWNAEFGARELVDAYRAADMSLDDFEGDKYVRLRRLRTLLDRGDLTADLRWSPAAVPFSA